MVYSVDGQPCGRRYRVPTEVLWEHLDPACRLQPDSTDASRWLGGTAGAIGGFFILFVAVFALTTNPLTALAIAGFGGGVMGGGLGALLLGRFFTEEPLWLVRGVHGEDGALQLEGIRPGLIQLLKLDEEATLEDGTVMTVVKNVPTAAYLFEVEQVKDELEAQTSGQTTAQKILLGSVITMTLVMFGGLILFVLATADKA